MESLLKEIFDLAGSLICHQLPERTLVSGGAALPVCARDTGIYAGVFTAFIFIIIMRRLNAQKPPGLAQAAVMAAMMVPMVLDGMLSYAGIIETNNTVRLFTGLFFGLPIPVLLVPAANFRADGRNDIPVLKKWTELIIVYGAGVFVCALILYEKIPYIASGLIYVSGLLALVSRFVFTLLKKGIPADRWKLRAMTVLGSASALALLYLLSAYILHPLKDLLLTS